MAHLLGSRYCIESLHNDVSDLQNVVIDVFSRTGPITQPSWKYPDKSASNVRMDELLETYVYTEDEEERQVAHIVLLELVVDRLLVFLQALAKYVDSMLASGRLQSGVSPSKNTSVGLVVKKYWNKMVQIHATSKQLHSESKSKSRKIQELEATVEALSEAIDNLRSGTGESVLSLTDNTGRKSVNPDAFLPGGMDSAAFANLLNSTASANKKKAIARDECNKSSQTIETAFVPCEACFRVQEHLREVGREFVSLCHNQEMPSLLDRHMGYVKDLDWMTHNDISRWVTEQNKDIRMLNRHLKNLKSTIEPLQEQLTKEQEKTKKLQDKVSSLTKQLGIEKETQSIQLGQITKKIDEAKSEKQKEIDVLQKEKERLGFAKRELEGQLQLTLDQLQKVQEKVRECEMAQNELEVELERTRTDNSEIRRLKSELKETECQLDKARGRLSDVSRDLNKEKAKGKSVNKHTEALQGKQDSLIQRIDELAEENEDLRGQLTDLHDDKDRLEDDIKEARRQRKELEERIEKYETSMRKLERNGDALDETKSRLAKLEQELAEANERERLIIEYPDLNGPVNKGIIGTGDIAVDMENQVKANSVRIKVLEDQNSSLRNTISRMLQLQTESTYQEDAASVPLWKQSASTSHITKVEVKEYDNNRSGYHGNQYDNDCYQGDQYNHGDHHNDNYSNSEEQQYGHSSKSQSKLSRPPSGYYHNNHHHQQSSHHDEDPDDNRLFFKRSTMPTDSMHNNNRPTKQTAVGEKDWVPPETFTVKPAPKPKSAANKSARQRPVSAKPVLGGGAVASRPNSSAISAYLSLKHSGRIKSGAPGGRTKSAKLVPDGYKAGDPITCDKCDKTYMHVKDLQIHKNYCFGGT